MLIPELPDYMKTFGAQKYLGLYISLFTLAAAISRPWSGKFSDLIGRKKVMLIGAIVTMVVGGLYLFFPIVGIFLWLRFLHGFSTGFFPTGSSAMVADLVPADRRGEAMGLLGVMINIATAIGPVIGGYIGVAFGFRPLFIVSALFGVVAVILTFLVKETLHVEQVKRFDWQMLKISKDEIIEKNVFYIALSFVLVAFCFGTVLTVFQDQSVSFGVENKGLYFTFLTVCTALVRIFLGKVPDRFGRANTTILGYSLLVVAMIAGGFATGRELFFSSAVIYGLAVGFYASAIFAWAVDLSPDMFKGRGLATIFLALEIGIGLGNVVAAYIYKSTNTFFWPYMLAALCVFFALGMIVRMKVVKSVRLR